MVSGLIDVQLADLQANVNKVFEHQQRSSRRVVSATVKIPRSSAENPFAHISFGAWVDDDDLECVRQQYLRPKFRKRTDDGVISVDVSADLVCGCILGQ